MKSLVRSRVLARELARVGSAHAIVALGTDLYDLDRVVPTSLPVATYDDGTFALFMRHPDSDLRRNRFPAREVGRWSARQAIAARRATACCVSTRWAAVSMVEDYGVEPDRVHIVGMGHRPRHFGHQQREWSDPRFLFVGVDWGRKNGDVVLRAFARLRAGVPPRGPRRCRRPSPARSGRRPRSRLLATGEPGGTGRARRPLRTRHRVRAAKSVRPVSRRVPRGGVRRPSGDRHDRRGRR